MKGYTSLEQSKKLAKILPIESADMWWNFYSVTTDNTTPQIIHLDTPWVGNFNWDNKSDNVPCWSLAALLDVLPPYLFEFERGIDLNIYPNLNGKGWHCSYMPNSIENMKTDKFKLITSGDTLVDACYEMIIKLHELNLL